MKIFIVGPENIDKLKYANALVAIDDNLNICKYFTSDRHFDGMIGEYLFHMDISDIELSFKNNVLYFIDYNDKKITGITYDDYESSDIIFINLNHFNMIPPFSLPVSDMILVWLDSCEHNENLQKEMIETNYLYETIEENNIPYLYFINEDINDIINIVNNYINADEATRREILEENS